MVHLDQWLTRNARRWAAQAGVAGRRRIGHGGRRPESGKKPPMRAFQGFPARVSQGG